MSDLMNKKERKNEWSVWMKELMDGRMLTPRHIRFKIGEREILLRGEHLER